MYAGKIQESESCEFAVACSCCEVGHAVRTLRTKEVVQRDAQDVDGRRKRLARPVPPMKNLRERVPVGEIELGGDHRREENDIREGHCHAAAGERMTHVPRVAEEDNTLLGVWPTLLDRWQERVGHAPETVLR
jgi:hypothetical protein